MEYVVVAFRSRSQTVSFCEYLKRNGLNCQIVNTPKEAGVGCGLSVKIGKGAFSTVKRVVMQSRLNTFAGFFLVTIANGQRRVKSI